MAKAKHGFPFKEVNPLGVPVRLRLVKEVDVLQDKYGCYDSEKSVISVTDGPIDRVQKTLVHEIVHHWQRHLGMGLSETMADQMELAVYDLLKNRRDLVKFLQRKKW